MKPLKNTLHGISRHVSTITAIAAICAGVVSTAPAVASDEKIRWKVQAVFNTGWPGLGDPIARVSETLKEATNGRINLKVYEPGKIVPPLEISPSISRGDLTAAYNYIGYDQGRIPASILFAAVPFGMEPWEYTTWWFEGEGHGLAEELYHKQKSRMTMSYGFSPINSGKIT